MTLLAMLLGLVLPACGQAGAAGVPAPTPIDFAHLVRPASPNTALAAPASFSPKPDLVTPAYPLTPETLFARARAVAQSEPRTYLQAAFPDRMQADYVARSAVFNFPDLVTVQVLPANDGTARLVLWSRSVYGRSDFGVNRKRLTTWIAALDPTPARSND
ncbi:MAG TPA: DUF1499 domain-containing protein [Acetobacteraceae bacterium]|nr:DUF1499 domain-containing protein [Acetobacteraceae bacterium]